MPACCSLWGAYFSHLASRPRPSQSRNKIAEGRGNMAQANGMSSPTFCTMGGMAHDSNMHGHRTLHDHSSIMPAMPVILPDDETDGGNASKGEHRGTDSHNHHGHHNHESHTPDHNQHSSSSSHSHSMPNMMSRGTTMYMDGFHTALFPLSQSSPPPCLNLFHPSWTLNTPGRFVFAMVCITLLGILVEACGVWRVNCLRKGRSHRREMKLKRLREWEEHQRRQQNVNMQWQQLEFLQESQRSAASDISDVSVEAAVSATAVSSMNRYICPAIVRRAWRQIVPQCIRNVCAKVCCCFTRTNIHGIETARRYELAAGFLHASRALLGYLLMLAVMTYAVEFLLSAVVGMVLGRYWFVDMESGGAGGGVVGGAVGVGGGIGGMGLGDCDGGRPSGVGLGMTEFQGHDGTWGGGDPCCGIDDDDDDDDKDHDVNESSSPLLSPLLRSNVGVTRRNGVSDIPT